MFTRDGFRRTNNFTSSELIEVRFPCLKTKIFIVFLTNKKAVRKFFVTYIPVCSLNTMAFSILS